MIGSVFNLNAIIVKEPDVEWIICDLMHNATSTDNNNPIQFRITFS